MGLNPRRDSPYVMGFPIGSTIWALEARIDVAMAHSLWAWGLRGSKKLNPRALSLYMGNGQRATVKAIGNYHLCLPSGLFIVLNNCHYAPSITRGIIYSMYAVSNKRAKLNLDSSLLWHCRLGHISKKRIEKLQHDGLLNSTDIESLGKCVSCMSGKMSRVFGSSKRAGIITHRTPPYTPQHNGVSERRNQTLLDMVRSMMSQTTLPKSFWDYALESAARILNMVPTKKVDKTPYEIWHGQASKLSYLKVWGCEALVKHDTLTKPNKLEPRSFKCIFVGYPKETIGYSFYNPSENKVFVSRNVEFFESNLIDQEAKDDQETDEPQSDINPIRRSTRTKRAPDRIYLYIDVEEHELGDLSEPANYKAALMDPESEKWLAAINVEIQSMKDNDV
ncbi:retrotransposon protein, putative, ty1-copia subclass [Tanacetum coccineum]